MAKTAPPKAVLEQIIKTIPTPFHLYDERTIREHARTLNHAFSWNVGFREYFAVKATPTPAILKIMKEEGCGVDCASLTELMLAEACGFSGDEIMFSSNMTPAEEYIYARKLGAIINLDDYTQVDFLEKTTGLPELVGLRLNPGELMGNSNFVMGEPSAAKFGMTEAQLFGAVERLSSKGVKRFALHSFLVSNALGTDYYPAIAQLLLKLAVEIQSQFGVSVEIVNLSGGVGIPYLPEETAPDIATIGEKVHKSYDELIPDKNIKIATELGRYMTGAAGYLVTTAVHKKNIYRKYIGLDSSAVDLMRPAIYGAYHHITIAGKENAPLTTKYDVVGALCENNDKFAVDRMLPNTEIGDIVVIHDTGAHGHSMGYNYNGKLRCAEVLLKEDGSFELIRRAQTPADYFSTLNFLPLDLPK